MNRYILIRRLRGPLFILLVGVNALLAQKGILGWGESWPFYLILAGVLALAERAAMAGEDYPPYPWTPGQGPGQYPGQGPFSGPTPGGYPGQTPYQGVYQGQYPPATGVYQGPPPPTAAPAPGAAPVTTSIVPASGWQELEKKKEEGQ